MHAHEHSHDHEHGTGDRGRLLAALALTGTFMVVEAVGGWLAGSLALIADAAHMLTDTASLLLAWIAFRVSDRPADRRRTFGYHRFPVLAAFVNGLALVAIVGWIGYEAVARLLEPTPVLGGTMLAIAVAGLVVNVAAFVLLHGGSRTSLNMRGAALHVLGDLLGSVGAIVAAGVIVVTGWTPIDPILSVVVALLVLRSAWYLLREATHVLLEGAPDEVDPAEIERVLPGAVAGISEVHHVHAWSLSPERPMLSLHARATGEVEHDRLVARIKRVLRERFGIGHATLQIEYGEECVDQRAEDAPGRGQDDQR
ncbi:MAG: cation diffusion facilitator family transporter [Halofilum sp. (in: g-proteobacteria)]|nr:cation diffusion facilitator family transporter [Halofilum sp. (in: g-proteobacteria)]